MKRQHAFLLMMANAVLVFALWWYDDPGDRALVSGGLLAGFVVIIALLLLARPRGFIATLGRGVAAAMIAVAATAFVGASLLVLLLTEYGPKRLTWTEYAFAIAFMVVNLALWRVLEPDPPGKPFIAKTAGAGCGVIVTFFVLFYLGEIINSLGPVLLAIPRMRADSVLMSSIPRVQACALSYMKAKARYPASLGEMGPAPAGSGCLDERYASGQLGRVVLQFQPGADGEHYRFSRAGLPARMVSLDSRTATRPASFGAASRTTRSRRYRW